MQTQNFAIVKLFAFANIVAFVLFYAISQLLNFGRCDGGTPWPNAIPMRVKKGSKWKIKLPWIMIPVSIKAVSCDHTLAVGARVCNTAN